MLEHSKHSRLFEDDAHPFASHFNQRIFHPLPCLLVGKDRAAIQMLRYTNYPYSLVCIISYKFLYT